MLLDFLSICFLSCFSPFGQHLAIQNKARYMFFYGLYYFTLKKIFSDTLEIDFMKGIYKIQLMFSQEGQLKYIILRRLCFVFSSEIYDMLDSVLDSSLSLVYWFILLLTAGGSAEENHKA